MTSGLWYTRILSSSPQKFLATVENVLKTEDLQMKPAIAESLLGPLRAAASAGVFPVPLPFPLSTSFDQAKKQAKVLYGALCSSGSDVNLTTSQHVIAKFYGYSSWQHFSADARKTKQTKIADDSDSSQTSPKDRELAVTIVYDWFLKKCRHLLPFIEKEFYAGLTRQDIVKLKLLPEERQNVVTLNRRDWLLSDAVVPGDGRQMVHLYLGPDGPKLTSSQRKWLEEMARRPLRLYEITSVDPGKGFRLRDVVDKDEPVRWVVDDSASMSLEQGDVFGGRLIQDGDWILSGCVYSFDAETGADIASRMQESISLAMKTQKWSFEDAYNNIAARALPGIWLEVQSSSVQLPHVVDAATGEDLAMVFDTYVIQGLQAVIDVFRGRSDVSGDAETGWVRNGSDSKHASTIKIDANGNLEAWSKSVGMADQTKWWMNTVLGSAVAYGSRKIVETGSDEFWDMMNEAIHIEEAKPEALRIIETEIGDKFLADYYRKWLDMPIPALDGKTPREATKTPAGRKEVEKLVDQAEKMSAANPKTARVNFKHIRKELGL